MHCTSSSTSLIPISDVCPRSSSDHQHHHLFPLILCSAFFFYHLRRFPRLHVVLVFMLPPHMQYYSLVVPNFLSNISSSSSLHDHHVLTSCGGPMMDLLGTSSAVSAHPPSATVGDLLEQATCSSSDHRPNLIMAVSRRLASAAAGSCSSPADDLDGTAIRVVELFLQALLELDVEVEAAKRLRLPGVDPAQSAEMGGTAAEGDVLMVVESGGDDGDRTISEDDVGAAPAMSAEQQKSIEAAYLAFNHAMPYLRFAHFTANQVMLEMMAERQRMASSAVELHVVDVGEAAQGMQWPPLMQAMATAASDSTMVTEVDGQQRRCSSSSLRLSVLRGDVDTGRRLAEVAAELGVPFRFFAAPTLAALLEHISPAAASPSSSAADQSAERRRQELVVLNCIYPSECSAAAAVIQSGVIRPDVVTVAGRHLSATTPPSRRNQLNFSTTATDLHLRLRSGAPAATTSSSSSSSLPFSACLRHFSALFLSLDSTLPPSNRHRHAIENTLLKRHISDFIFTYRYQDRGRRLRRHDDAGKLAATAHCSSSSVIGSESADGRNHQHRRGRRRKSPTSPTASAGGVDEEKAAAAVDRLIRQITRGRQERRNREAAAEEAVTAAAGSGEASGGVEDERQIQQQAAGADRPAEQPSSADLRRAVFGVDIEFCTHETIVAAVAPPPPPYDNQGNYRRRPDDVDPISQLRRRHPLPLSTVAVAQAKLLLRLHYPSDGYQLHHHAPNSLLLAWQDTPLFAFSAWH